MRFLVSSGVLYICEQSTSDYTNSSIDKIEIEGEYYYCAISRPESIILGQIVYIPEEFMTLVDDYEGEDYKRVSVKTLSDVECLMYVKR